MKMTECNKDCSTCKHLSAKVDGKGYPWAWECVKYDGSVFPDQFSSTKIFSDNEGKVS